MIDEYQIFLNKMDLEAGAWYFFEKHFQSNIPTSAFVPYPYQQELLLTYKNNNNIIVTYPRQTGLTTATAHYIIWKIAFFKTNIIIISCNSTIKYSIKSTLLNILKSYKSLPSKPIIINKNNLILDNYSSVYFAVSPDDLRGRNGDIIWVDDFSLFDNQLSHTFMNLIPISLMSSKSPQTIITGYANDKPNHFTALLNNPSFVKVHKHYDF